MDSYSYRASGGYRETGKREFFAKTYGTMAVGLLITFATAFLVAYAFPYLAYNTFLVVFLMIAQLVVVVSFSRKLMTASYQTAVGMFILYAALTGVTLSTIFLVFDISTISLCFLMTAVAYGVMALYGHFTKADLSPLRGILMGGLIALILTSVVGIFFFSRAMDTVISCVGVVIFLIMTAYDTQKLSAMYASSPSGDMTDRLSIYGAMQLYLDFLNLFLYLLRLLSRNRRN